MPYVGRDLQRGNYLKLDDLESQFNGSKTTFNLESGGSAFYPGSAYSILVSLGGIVQEPESAYTINQNTITFAAAPVANDEFFCIALGVALGVGVPGHGTVNGSQLASPFEYDNYFYLDSANNRVGIHSSTPTVALDVKGDIKLSGSLIGAGGGIGGGIGTFTGLDVNGNADISGNLNVGGVLTYEDVTNVDAIGIVTARTGVRVLAGGVGIADTIFHIGDTDTSMRFNSDEIVFATGAASKVFINDDGDLTVGASEGNLGKIFIKQAADSDTEGLALLNSGGGNSFRLFLGDSSGAVAHLGHGGQKQVNVTQAGNVGIGITNPTKDFEVYRNGLVNAKIKGNVAGGLGAELILQNANTAANGYTEIQFQDAGTNVFSKLRGFNLTDGSNNGYLSFYTASATEGLKERVRILDDGKVGINTSVPLSGLHISDGTVYGSAQNPNRKAALTISAGSEGSADIQLLSANYNHIFFGDSADPNTGIIWYEHTGGGTDSLNFSSGGNKRFNITSDGTLNKYISGTTVQAAFPGSGQVNGIASIPAAAGTPFIVGRDSGTTRSAHFAGHLKFDSGYGIQGTEFSVYGNTTGLYLNSLVSGDHIIFQTHNGSSLGERVRISSTGQVHLTNASSSTTGTSVTDLLIANNAAIRFRNGANNAWINTLGLDGSNQLKLGWGGSTTEIHFGISGIGEQMKLRSTGDLIIGNGGSNFGNATVQSFSAHGSTAGESGFSSVDTTAVAAGVGGEIAFHGKYNTGAQDYAYFGHVRGIKENGTAGNTACALTFHTRPNATGPQERLRIASTGYTSISHNATAPESRLHVTDNAATNATALFDNPHTSSALSGNTASNGFSHALCLENSNQTVGNICSLGFQNRTSGSWANAAITSKSLNTSGDVDLIFWTENSNTIGERLRITNTGQILLAGATTSTAHADADDLVLNERAGGNVGITFKNSGTGYGVIYFADNSSQHSGRIQYDHSNDTLDLFAGGGERVRIDGNGMLHISDRNSATPGAHVFQAGAFGIRMEDTGGFNRWNIERNYGGWQTTPVVHLSTEGKVGINTSDPEGNAALDIWGDGSSYPTLRLGTEVYQVEGEDIRFGRLDHGSTDIRYHSITSRHDATAGANYLRFKLHDAGSSPYQSQRTVLELRGDGRVGVGKDITPARNLHVQEHLVVANIGTNSGQPYVSSTPILAVTTDGSAAFPGDTTYHHNAIVAFGVGNHNAGNPGSNAMPGKEYFRLNLNGMCSIGEVDNTPNATLHLRSVSDNTTNLVLDTHDNYNGTYPDADITFKQATGTEIAKIRCDTNTGAANRAALSFFTNHGGLNERMRIEDNGTVQFIDNTLFSFNKQCLQRGYFQTNTSSQTSTNCPDHAGTMHYTFGFQEAFSTSGGGWTYPYPDLVMGYHTGMRFGGYHNYGGMRFYSDHPNASTTLIFSVNNGNSGVHVTNTFTAGTKTFRIVHPHPSKKYTHDLVHSVIEGPQCDNMYRGKVDLVGGSATINLDTVSNMTDGTFVLLNRDIQCFTTNETGWTAVKGSVSGNVLTITAQDNSCTDTISWMVIGERQDDKIKSPDVEVTDSNGKLITEPLTVEQTHM